MLHVKQPDTRARPKEQHKQLRDQISLPAEGQPHDCDDHGQRKVGPPHAGDLTLALRGRNPLADHEDQQRPDQEQGERIAHHTVPKLFPPRRIEILLKGHRVHVAHAAAVEVPAGGVMDGVFVLPAVIWCEGQQSGQDADPVIPALRCLTAKYLFYDLPLSNAQSQNKLKSILFLRKKSRISVLEHSGFFMFLLIKSRSFL